MKKGIVITILLSFFCYFAGAEKVAVFPQLYKVSHLAVDDEQIYICQELNIFIFSSEDYRLVKKFGSPGEGPGEFREYTQVFPRQDHLVVNSAGKISFYSKGGTYLREIKTPSAKVRLFTPLGSGYVADGYTEGKQGRFHQTINLYNHNLAKIREIYRSPGRTLAYAKGGKINLMYTPFSRYRVAGTSILITHADGSIMVYEKSGQPSTTIKGDYEKIPLQEKHKRALVDSLLLANPGKRSSYNEWKKRLSFPPYFPPIQLFQVSEDKVFVLTHKRVGQLGECYIYNVHGKLLKHTMVPIMDYNPKDPFPLALHKGTLYQICENQEAEAWELHINRLL
jgi:hypothetical protein